MAICSKCNSDWAEKQHKFCPRCGSTTVLPPGDSGKVRRFDPETGKVLGWRIYKIRYEVVAAVLAIAVIGGVGFAMFVWRSPSATAVMVPPTPLVTEAYSDAKRDVTKANSPVSSEGVQVNFKKSPESSTQAVVVAKVDTSGSLSKIAATDTSNVSSNPVDQAKLDEAKSTQARLEREKFEKAMADQEKDRQAKLAQAKRDQAIADQLKIDQAKAAQAKAEQEKAQQLKLDQAKARQAMLDQANLDQLKLDQAKAEQAKLDDAKAQMAKAEKATADAARISQPVTPVIDIAGLLRKGQSARQNGNLDGALEAYSQVLAQDPKSADARLGISQTANRMFQFGHQYESGEGVAVDARQAAAWYEKAAKQGDMQAQRAIARCYAQGSGVSKNDSVAQEWYRSAAPQYLTAATAGDPEAQLIVGEMFEARDGQQGVTQNFADASKWYHKATEHPNPYPIAFTNIGKLYLAGHGLMNGGTQEPQKNKKDGIFWLTKAKQLGEPEAQKLLETLKD